MHAILVNICRYSSSFRLATTQVDRRLVPETVRFRSYFYHSGLGECSEESDLQVHNALLAAAFSKRAEYPTTDHRLQFPYPLKSPILYPLSSSSLAQLNSTRESSTANQVKNLHHDSPRSSDESYSLHSSIEILE